VTGWALDDVEVSGVKISRPAAAGEVSSPPGLVFIGDAVFIEGARPDVEQSFPASPLSYRAGWGYMLLSNFLPNGGNGPFTLVAVAADKEGHSVELGRKAITCNNANANKPFGAIDTPAQGGTASGAAYVNFGWALTPLPAMIPANGSTITVYIDGIGVGHPTYNQYRSDIATGFPGYLNSNGAVGYFYVDATKYADGLHTIAWAVADNAGRVDGIGSRFFSILNSGGSPEAAAARPGSIRLYEDASFLETIPADSAPLLSGKGFGKNRKVPVYSGRDGGFDIALGETGRLVMDLDRGMGDGLLSFSGYLRVGKTLRPLPVGSTLDLKSGVFSWQPGPGFLGDYEFVFVTEREGSPISKTSLRVRIGPD
jgi:hypothetical protein